MIDNHIQQWLVKHIQYTKAKSKQYKTWYTMNILMKKNVVEYNITSKNKIYDNKI